MYSFKVPFACLPTLTCRLSVVLHRQRCCGWLLSQIRITSPAKANDSANWDEGANCRRDERPTATHGAKQKTRLHDGDMSSKGQGEFGDQGRDIFCPNGDGDGDGRTDPDRTVLPALSPSSSDGGNQVCLTISIGRMQAKRPLLVLSLFSCWLFCFFAG